MRRDAADARKYGCTGLMGIHWRDAILGPNVAALARAAWDQSGWEGVNQAAAFGPRPGGQVANYPNNPIDATDDDVLYQTCRFNFRGYRLAVPNGEYKVTLKFCEPAYNQPGVRVFDVFLDGRKVIDALDIFARAGQNKALDFTFKDVEVKNACLDIDFAYRVELPCISAIAIEGKHFTKNINCGGPAYKDFEADPPPVSDHLPSGDFYNDWAAAEFGSPEAGAIAAIFEKLDGRLRARPTGWTAPAASRLTRARGTRSRRNTPSSATLSSSAPRSPVRPPKNVSTTGSRPSAT